MPSFPNRCQHIKVNGTLCGSPALRRNRFCYFHKLHHEELIQLNFDRAKTARARRRRIAITLPVLEDANAIQVSLMQIMRLIISGEIDGKNAGLLLYALQTASSNLPRTRFEPYLHDVVLDPKAVHEIPLGSYIWEDEDFLTDEEEEEEEDESAREGFIPSKPEEARNQAELDRWASAEADRLAIIGASQRRAEDLAEQREEELYQESLQAEEDAKDKAEEAAAAQLIKNLASKLPIPAATVTPAGRAVLPAKTPPPPSKRPPEKASLDEVRKKVTAQIVKALPAIAAAVKANEDRSG